MLYILIILSKFLIYYFQCKYIVTCRSSIYKSILIVPYNFLNIWFNSSQCYIRQNFVSYSSQCYSPVILTPISVSFFVYRNYTQAFPDFNLLLFSSCLQYWFFLGFIPKYLKFVPLFQWFCYLSLCCDFVLHCVSETWTWTRCSQQFLLDQPLYDWLRKFLCFHLYNLHVI